MPARSVCLVTLSLSEAGPGRFGRQASVTDIYMYHTIPCHALPAVIRNMRLNSVALLAPLRSVQFSSVYSFVQSNETHGMQRNSFKRLAAVTCKGLINCHMNYVCSLGQTLGPRFDIWHEPIGATGSFLRTHTIPYPLHGGVVWCVGAI